MVDGHIAQMFAAAGMDRIVMPGELRCQSLSVRQIAENIAAVKPSSSNVVHALSVVHRSSGMENPAIAELRCAMEESILSLK